ncbi:hypothetical protein TEQG_00385 [Trichophyton equinum CBS 127.97]|uniref:Uncharacterized protein n=1 Tax=Trichophyton equinum (strain ATCC MYA-4606 / CBS 127.97) TaxID=559882 RepID=F2PHG4_TRIEC|nr:hypothetical protein TEQG_00385 [Trichophyton equinum CBS 127.97]
MQAVRVMIQGSLDWVVRRRARGGEAVVRPTVGYNEECVLFGPLRAVLDGRPAVTGPILLERLGWRSNDKPESTARMAGVMQGGNRCAVDDVMGQQRSRDGCKFRHTLGPLRLDQRDLPSQ